MQGTYFCSVVGLYLYGVYLNLMWLQSKAKSGQRLRIILEGGQAKDLVNVSLVKKFMAFCLREGLYLLDLLQQLVSILGQNSVKFHFECVNELKLISTKSVNPEIL